MHYSTQELTDSLQELASRATAVNGRASEELPPVLRMEDFPLSDGVDQFLRGFRSYADRTRDVSFGNY